jgi:hypothetical protein
LNIIPPIDLACVKVTVWSALMVSKKQAKSLVFPGAPPCQLAAVSQVPLASSFQDFSPSRQIVPVPRSVR